MPTSTKANLTMGTDDGKLYAAGDFNGAITPKTAEDERAAAKAAKVKEEEGVTATVTEALAATLDSLPNIVISTPSSGTDVLSIAGMFRGGMGENIDGTINGGGIDLILNSTYSSEKRRVGKECVSSCKSRWS